MTDYLYVFRGGASDPSDSAQAQADEMKRWASWIQGLAQKGHMKGGEPLEREGKVLRGRSKNLTDGPYADAKDRIGGYLIVSAASLEEATELAKGCPIFEKEVGSLEVRPIAKLNM